MGLLVVAVALALNAYGLAPEIRIERVPVNDLAFHIPAAQDLGRALIHRELEPWTSEWSLGFPLWRVYQPLPHVLAALWMAAANPFASASASFAWLYYLFLLALPATTYVGARWFGLEPLAAGLAALLIYAPSEPNQWNRYGITYGAYVWRGSGLYTQLVAFNLMLPALGCTRMALDWGGRRAGAIVLLTATALSHIIFGYAAFVSVAVITLVGPVRQRSHRVVRAATIVLPSLLLLAWFVTPMLLTAGEVNRSHWDPSWKFDSFGARVVLAQLFSGRFLDNDRWPVLTLALLLGLLVALYQIEQPLARRLLVLVVLWLGLFFGRTTWDGLMALVGLPAQFQVSRFEAVFELFAVLLIAHGLATLLVAASGAGRLVPVVAGVGLGAMLLAIGQERAAFLSQSANWGEQTLAAYASQRADLDAALGDINRILAVRPGQVYAGKAAQWGGSFRVGQAWMYSFLSRAHLDDLSFLYHTLPLSSDLMYARTDGQAADDRLYALRAALAPITLPPAADWHAYSIHGPFAVYQVSPEGYFGLVDIVARYQGALGAVLHQDNGWLHSAAMQAGITVTLGHDGERARKQLSNLPALGALEPIPAPLASQLQPRGTILSEHKRDEVYSARVIAKRACYAMLKITYFPGLRARVDGQPAPILRVFPNFCAVALAPGEHRIAIRYAPGPLKPLLLLAGIVVAAWMMCRMGQPDWDAFEERAATALAWGRQPLPTAAPPSPRKALKPQARRRRAR
ncbi:MAG TPA: hypothetical protein VKV28_03065 [Candidatus Binataceae bacterium]|nr:hypothetical protein [Candidatus Binataceae bacterium]